MIELQQLHFRQGGQPVLEALDLHILHGQSMLILGPSGCGKTSLLHLIAGLATPDAGDVMVDGISIPGLSAKTRDQWRGKQIGMIFQTLHLVQALTVMDNLRLARMMAGLPADDERARTLLERVGLAGKAGLFPRQLSLGQAQRVAIARALMNQPRWILADEPTSALDDNHCSQILELLEEQALQHHATLVIATHDQRLKQRYSHQYQLETVKGAAA